MKVLGMLLIGLSFLIFPSNSAADVQSRCGDYLREAMDIGAQVQQLKEEKRYLSHRVSTGRSRNVRADRSRTGELAQQIRELERNYESAAQRFSQCVERYKEDLNRQYRNREITRDEYRFGQKEALHMMDQLLPIPGNW